MRRMVEGALCVTVALTWFACTRKPEITQDDLVHRTQELVDAVAVGDQAPRKKYFADDTMYFDEKGRNMNKEKLVADITPLPAGSSGKIVVRNPQSHIEANVAILSYDLDETEIIYGQVEKARYHETDTWMRRDGGWKIVAAQALRYYQDPAPGAADVREFKDYLGAYALAPVKTLTISQQGQQLFLQRKDRPKVELIPEGGPVFFRKGVEGRTLFRRAADGKIDALIDRRNNEDVVWTKQAGG